jgi:hypothetical protein
MHGGWVNKEGRWGWESGKATVSVEYCLRNRVWNFKAIVTTSRGEQTRKWQLLEMCLDFCPLHSDIRQLIAKYIVLYPLRLNTKDINAHAQRYEEWSDTNLFFKT